MPWAVVELFWVAVELLFAAAAGLYLKTANSVRMETEVTVWILVQLAGTSAALAVLSRPSLSGRFSHGLV